MESYGIGKTSIAHPAQRFYEQSFPEPEDLVMVRVTRIAEMGAYAALLEYNNIEGMILMSELSKRRFRSVNKLVRVGRHEVVMVLRVDKEKGYIDLSKRRVSLEDIAKCEDRYSKSKKVFQTAHHVAKKHDLDMEELNRKIVWPLYKKYGHAFEGFKDAVTHPERVFESLDVSDEIKGYFEKDIRLRLSATALKLQAYIHVACFGYDGINAVKDALLSGKKAVSNENVEIKVKLIAAPQYVIYTSGYDKAECLQRIGKALKAVEDKILSYKGGEYKLQEEVHVIGGDHEKIVEHPEEESSGESSEEEEDTGMGLVDEVHLEDIPTEM